MEREFSFSEFMHKADSNADLEEIIQKDRYYCPESIGRHNAPDPQGRCSWCGRIYAPKKERGKIDHKLKPDTLLSYEYMWDPDFGSSYYDVWPS